MSRIRERAVRIASIAALTLAMGLSSASRSVAHDVPTDVMVLALVKPEGSVLRLLVRAPLEAMQDFQFPTNGPYLDLVNADRMLRDAAIVWISDSIRLYEGTEDVGDGTIVAIRVSLPSDRSFRSYPEAVAHVSGDPLPATTQLPWRQGMLDVLFEYPIASEQSDFSIEPALARLGLRTTTVLRFVTPDRAERAFQYSGNPGLVRLDPRWHQAALRFVGSGFFHILDGIDHLLFLLCLVIPVRRLRPLVAVVTSFTVAHSITLIASALGLAPGALWFPALIETLIALSIVYMAIENVVAVRLQHRWMIAFGFGLVHGFGFSFALRDTLQFAGSHLWTSLLSFNIGVEIGQLFVLALIVPLLRWLFRSIAAEQTAKIVTIVLSTLIAHEAWHWMTARGGELLEYRFQWPALDLLLLAQILRWATLAAILVSVLWALSIVFGKHLLRRPEPPSPLLTKATTEP